MAGCHNDNWERTFFAKAAPQGQQNLKQFSTPGQEPKCVTFALFTGEDRSIKSVKLSHAQKHENRFTNGLLKYL